ncbi:HutD family protein [Clostridium sp. UBA7503]|uniref:HutD/Ves family protein n=1 Tax=Clostridium sp. UBA7503 TaxID=1946377 RepID=UPI003216E0C0
MGFKTEIITKDKIKTSSWSGGTTNEIYIYPKNSNYMELNFKWRISSATVELEHSTFTNVPKIYRYITTLEGSMDLCHNKGPLIHLEPFEVHGFSGDVNTESFGTVTDFNLMIGPGCYGVMDALTLTEDSLLKLNLNKRKNKYSYHNYIFFSPNSHLTFTIDGNNISLPKNDTLIIESCEKDSLSSIEIASSQPCNIISIEVGF